MSLIGCTINLKVKHGGSLNSTPLQYSMVLSWIPDSGESGMGMGLDPRSPANRGWGWGWGSGVPCPASRACTPRARPDPAAFQPQPLPASASDPLPRYEARLRGLFLAQVKSEITEKNGTKAAQILHYLNLVWGVQY
jgi:hypothetical protein